jgi:putative PIN family toxin of toxin-antitoxin system
VISAVLDTNVLVSGFVGFSIADSTQGEIMRRWRAGAFELALSGAIIEEFAAVIERPYFARRLSADLRASDVALLAEEARIVVVTARVSGVAPDPDDDIVLATAASARADYLVTGDRALEAVVRIGDTLIVRPRAFLDALEAEG